MAIAQDFIRTTGDYVLLVLWGSAVVLVLSTLVGYLPYSDRPGPGWDGVQQTASWANLWFVASWIAFSAIYVFAAGVILYLGARLLALIRAPRWLVSVIGGIASGCASLYLIAAMGWYIAVDTFPVYAAGILGLLFGGFLLPKRINEHGNRPQWRHWAALGAPLVIFFLSTGTVYVKSFSDQRLELIFVRWTEGRGT